MEENAYGSTKLKDSGPLEYATLSIRNMTVREDITDEKAKQNGSFMTHARI